MSSGLFSCCGYDTTAEKECTLNIVAAGGGSSPSSASSLHCSKFPPPGAVTSREDDGGSSVMTLSPEQKEREKARLQALVKHFAKAAVGGVSCKVLELSSGNQTNARYVFDKALTTFTVSVDSGLDTVLPMSSLQEVYSYEDLAHSANTEFLTREPVVASLTFDQKARLVVLEYLEPLDRSYLKRLFVLEQSGEAESAKDRFVTCMKILRLYALTANTPAHPQQQQQKRL
eukprot:GHVS01082827.1.p1 GENE.GHVS01082827.1~~GHVS01082827.1.p1  ORF type:complete len:230 (-),score=44.03 GHVS01082827.1:205-894(-)